MNGYKNNGGSENYIEKKTSCLILRVILRSENSPEKRLYKWISEWKNAIND